jgi:hypothetical protein
MEVTIDVAIQDASAGTLITADGQRWAATRSEVLEGGTHLIYLVPLAESTQPAGWEISSAGDLPGFLSLQLPAPESRAAILRRVLDVHTGVASIAIHDDVMEATIVLTVTLDTQAAPLTLLPGDLVVERGGAASEARWDPPALTPGQSTTIEVRVPLRTGDTLDIALASWRARLTTE